MLRLAIALALGIALAGIAVVWQTKNAPSPLQLTDGQGVQSAPFGGDFDLVDHTGQKANLQRFAGKPLVLFFGFTHCPDICPTTLLEAGEWLKALGKDADKITLAFVSVDPERDSAEGLKLYLSSFDSRLVGLTGTAENVAAMIKAYRIHARKVPLESGSYTMEHTTALLQFDRRGKFVGLIDPKRGHDAVVESLRKLIAQ